jgi:hypothetical protein
MEIIKIKRREFEITEKLSENKMVATRKGKKFLITSFEPHSHEGDLLVYSFKRIDSSPITSPKLALIDKKNGYVVTQYIEAESMMDFLAMEDVTEDILDQLFRNAYFARSASMSVDYSPKAWGLCEGKLYYLENTFTPYAKENDLVEKYIRLWFNTRELSEYLKNNGVFYDKNRIIDEYSVNKQIVLMACKYYR